MPTIRDVAKKAGVGVATVSRHIAGNGPVSDKTAKRIQRAIAELHYRPSHIARALPAGATRTIGVYLPFIYGAFYAPILHAICVALEANDLHMMVAIGSNETSLRHDTLQGARFLADHGCDGLLVTASSLEADDFSEILELAPHTIFLNRLEPRHRANCFAPDHAEGGRLAAETLWEAGHRRFGIIAGNPSSANNRARMKGFINELKHRGVDPADIPTEFGYFSPEGGKKAAAALLAQNKRFTALFCANDESASGALSLLYERGVSVPRDMSVLGYDGLATAPFTAPPLTTIRQPWTEICVNAVHALINERYALDLPIRRKFTADVWWHSSVAQISSAD